MYHRSFIDSFFLVTTSPPQEFYYFIILIQFSEYSIVTINISSKKKCSTWIGFFYS